MTTREEDNSNNLPASVESEARTQLSDPESETDESVLADLEDIAAALDDIQVQRLKAKILAERKRATEVVRSVSPARDTHMFLMRVRIPTVLDIKTRFELLPNDLRFDFLQFIYIKSRNSNERSLSLIVGLPDLTQLRDVEQDSRLSTWPQLAQDTTDVNTVMECVDGASHYLTTCPRTNDSVYISSRYCLARDSSRLIGSDVPTEVEVKRTIVANANIVGLTAHNLGLKLTKKQGFNYASAAYIKCIFTIQLLASLPLASAGEVSFTQQLIAPYWTYFVAFLSNVFNIMTTSLEYLAKSSSELSVATCEQGLNAIDTVITQHYEPQVDVSLYECLDHSFSESNPLDCLIRYVFTLNHETGYEDIVPKYYASLTKPIFENQRLPCVITLVVVFIITTIIVVLATKFASKVFKTLKLKLSQRRARQNLSNANNLKVSSPRNSVNRVAPRVLEYASTVVEKSCLTTLEMAISGSEPFKPKHIKFLVAFLISDTVDGVTNNTVVGLGFRYKDYLITAKHVYDRVESHSGDTAIAPFKEEALTGQSTIDLIRFKALSDVEMHNVVQEDISNYYDFVVLTGFERTFSIMGLGAAGFGSAVWNCPVKTVGLVDGPTLHAAAGSVERDGSIHIVSYSATTYPGWSGGPVLAGKRVVAMHKSARGDHNEGLNVEVIKACVNYYEQLTDEDSDTKYQKVRHGVARDRFGVESDYQTVDVGGSRSLGFLFRNTQTGKTAWGDVDSDTEEDFGMKRNSGNKGYNVGFDDEDGDIKLPPPNYPNRQIVEDASDFTSNPPKEGVYKRFLRPDHLKHLQLLEGTHLHMLDHKSEPVNAPIFKGFVKEVQDVLDLKTAETLGYEPAKYCFPDLKTPMESKDQVKESLYKHLSEHERRRVSAVEPNPAIVRSAVSIVLEQCAAMKYQMIKDPLSKDNLLKIINSTCIDSSKSPGYPYIGIGMNTNGQVIEHGGLVEAVQNQTEPSPANVFPKIEPTKVSKLEAGMVRVILGVGLRDQIKTHAYFANLNTSACESYYKTPVMIGFSPLKPNDANMFIKRLKGNMKAKKSINWLADDIKTWDYNMFGWIIRAVAEVAVALAIPTADMTVEETLQWREDATAQALEQFKLSFRLPDGTTIERTQECIMTSGSVLTLIFNSLSMLLLDNIAKLQMGYSRKSILTEFTVLVGGDDKQQAVPSDFDHSLYIKKYNDMGVVTHAEDRLTEFNGVEFYSWKFSEENGESVWVPTRFTKHVYNLLATKLDNVGQALVSHMYNWVHSDQHFHWFRSQYMAFHRADPKMFPIKHVPNQRELIDYLRGYESHVDAHILTALQQSQQSL